jgi:lysophospholipase L1-like esterase
MRRSNTFRPQVLELEGRALPSHGPAPFTHAGPVTVGALGDSYTDEYRFYPPDRSRARNWVEMLSATRGVSFGPFTTHSRGEPRNQGFAFDWALSGATSNDMVRDQLPGLAAQVARGKVRYAWVFIGGNDFLYLLRNLATGRVTPDQALTAIGQVESQVEANFTFAVNTLLAANPKVKLVVSTVPEVSLLPLVRTGAALIPGAGPVIAAAGQQIQKYDALIRNTAAGNGRVALVDLAAAAAQLSAAARGGSAPFGGTTIDLGRAGDGFHHFFLADGIHAGTVGQGLIAEGFVQAVDAKFGAHLRPLTPRQIVQFARTIQSSTP